MFESSPHLSAARPDDEGDFWHSEPPRNVPRCVRPTMKYELRRPASELTLWLPAEL